MKIERTMCRQPISMVMAFLGFILLMANLPAADCTGKEIMNDTNTSGTKAQAETEDTLRRILYVGQLPDSITGETLRQHFKQFGDVEKAAIKKDQKTGKSQGFGFVKMKEQTGAERALQHGHIHTINGELVKVAPYENRKNNSAAQSNSPKMTTEILNDSNLSGTKNTPAAESVGKRKIFVGHLPDRTTDETLLHHFQHYGEVEEAVVIKDGHQRSKGFGFVTMKNEEDVKKAFDDHIHIINGALVNVEEAKASEKGKNNYSEAQSNSPNQLPETGDIDSKRIFVGGLSSDTTDETLRDYFQQFGIVEKAEVKRFRNHQSRRFGFVTMKEEEDVKKALDDSNPIIDGKRTEVKMAESWTKKASTETDSDDIALRKIFVGGLSIENTTDETLQNYFGQFGEVEKAVVIKNRLTQESNGFVTMKKAEDAEKACRNKNPIIDGRETHVNLAAEMWNNRFLASHSSNFPIHWPQFQHQNYAPQSSAYRIFQTPGGTFIQPGIFLPKSAAAQIHQAEQRTGSFMPVEVDPSTIYTAFPSREQMFGMNMQPSQIGSMRLPSGHATGSTSQNHPFQSESNINIRKRLQRPRSAPAILRANEHHFANNNNNERENLQNIAIDNDEEKKDSKMEGKKSIEEESAGIEKKDEERDDSKHTLHDEPNFALKTELMPSEKYGGATLESESSSKMETGKMSWADMVEEEDEKMKETDKRKIFVRKLPKSATDETLRNYFGKFGEIDEAVVIINRRTQESKGYGFVTMKKAEDAGKALQNPHPIINDQKVNLEARKNKPFATVSNSTNQLEEGQKKKLVPNPNIEDRILNVNTENNKHLTAKPNEKEEMHVGGHSEADKDDNLIKDNVNNPIKHKEVPSEASRKTYLDAIKKSSKVVSKKVAHSVPANTSKVGGEAAIEKNNLTNKIEGKKQENDEKRQIFVGQLPDRATDETLLEYFQQFGVVENAKVISDKPNQTSKYGFVKMKEVIGAERALRKRHPIIDGRKVYLRAYEDSKRKNKHFMTPTNSSNQLQEERKKKANPNTDGPITKMNLASIEMEEKPFGEHSLADQDDKLSKDNVNNPIKSGEISAAPPKNSYLNVTQTSSQILSKKEDLTHSSPASTSKVGREVAIKKKNNANKAKDVEKIEQENSDRDLRRIFVGGLDTTDEKLREYFEQFGEVEEAEVKRYRDRYSHISRGFGYVTMKKQEDMEKALLDPNPIIDGKQTELKLAKPRTRKAPTVNLSQDGTEKVAFEDGNSEGGKLPNEGNINLENEQESDDMALRRIFVGGLSFENTTDETLHNYFEQFGEVEEALVERNQKTGKSKGFGYVTMKKQEDVKKALEDTKPFIDGQQTRVEMAISMKKKATTDLSKIASLPNEGSSGAKIPIKQEKNKGIKEKRAEAKVRKMELMRSEKDGKATSVPESSSDKAPDESVNIEAKGIKKIAKNQENE